MGLALGIRSHAAKAMGTVDTVVRETVLEFADRLTTEWTPFGNPELWKSPPPADYRPGNLQSSWFFSVGAPSRATTERTDIRAVNDLDQLPEHAGQKVYLTNNAPHAGAIEDAHSSQAPIGIMWAAGEFSPMAATIARRHSS
ncbi:hypothetical protein [Phenylobacterium sp.]|uniref:hypothetical protein n=1 Tax=Phenylobacterium sp. TaxID=1871053 RepID=UPI00272F791D|nr:hypothetical protein [Phenylobacterium sp.]MDP1599016.1 hypothetical protein [Phenylobacterium sp.]MDP3590444.1 hypothetical protein [Phenylobacterium sp.]